MENEKQIYQLINNILGEIGTIEKAKKNKQQGFMFRGIDDVYKAIHPLLAKYRLFTIPEVLETHHEERKTKSGGNLIYRIYKIKYTVYAPDGSNVSGVVVGEGMDSGDKAGNKAMSVAHKYFYLQLFSIPTENNDDPDNDSHEPSTPTKSEEEFIIEQIENLGKRMISLMKTNCFNDEEREKFKVWLSENKTVEARQNKLIDIQKKYDDRKKEVY